MYGTPVDSTISRFLSDKKSDFGIVCNNNLYFKPIFFYRYVDDIASILRNNIQKMIEIIDNYDLRYE